MRAATRSQSEQRRSTFFFVRVTALLLVLVAVGARARATQQRRQERAAWQRPLGVALVLLGRGGVPGDKADLVRERLPRLEEFFAREHARHGGWLHRPVAFTLAGAAAVEEAPPKPPADAGLPARALHAWRLSRYLAAAHARGGIEAAGYDARLYLLVEPVGPRQTHLYGGMGEAGGDVGLVTAQFDSHTVDLALATAGHELLHCLGASDKYDEAGHAVAPGGLAEPELAPTYPQRFAEIMVGEVPLGPASGRLPESLDEFRVGSVTAAEIGWTGKPRAP